MKLRLISTFCFLYLLTVSLNFLILIDFMYFITVPILFESIIFISLLWFIFPIFTQSIISFLRFFVHTTKFIAIFIISTFPYLFFTFLISILFIIHYLLFLFLLSIFLHLFLHLKYIIQVIYTIIHFIIEVTYLIYKKVQYMSESCYILTYIFSYFFFFCSCYNQRHITVM